MRTFLKIAMLLMPILFGFEQNAFGQPSNYYWEQEFNGGQGANMHNDVPVNGIISYTQEASSAADEFNVNWDNNYNKWQNNSTPFNQVYTIYWCSDCSYKSKLLTPPISGHYYTLQIEGLAYSNRNAVLMETTNTPQSFATTNPVTPSNPSIAPDQDLNLTITLAGNKSPEEKAFVRCTKDGFTTSYLVEVSFSTNTASSGTAVIPGSYNTAGSNIYFYVYTTTVAATPSSNHDLITLKLANNGGSNYHYSVKSEWKATTSGNWNDASTWETNAVPPDNQEIEIATGSKVTITSGTVKIHSLVMGSGGGAELIGNTNTTVAFPGGGYATTYGAIFKPYNLDIGEDIPGGPLVFYVNNDFEIQNDLNIRQNGKLQPGGNATPTINMSGFDGSIYNEGYLDSNPDPDNTGGEKLKFYFSGNTFLRGNGALAGDRTRFSDITIPSGGSLTSDAAGTLYAELQFGTLTCNGTFNMGVTGPGVVDFTLRGTNDNTYNLKSSTEGQVFQFHNLIIGNSSTGIVKLGLDNSSESVVMRISSNFEDYDLFESSNTGSKTIKTIFNGDHNEQIIRAQKGQTFSNLIAFSQLEIDNTGGSVTFKTTNGGKDPEDNIQISITDKLTLTNGRLITLVSEGNPVVETRHKLLLETGATIDYSGAQSSESQPCYIEGPISHAVSSGNNQEFEFPVGQGNDYRLLTIQTDVSAESEFTVESFHYSPADFPGMSLESPILNISDTRFWNIKTTNPANTSNTVVSLAYGNMATDGVSAGYENDLRIAWAEEDASTDWDPSNNTWKSLGPDDGGSSGTITSDPFSFGALPNKIDITLGNVHPGVNPLPVTWVDFNGSHTYLGNELEWITGSESNNSHFEIERSEDARDFKVIGKVNSAGDSRNEQFYHFTDRLINSPIYYYRIKQVDRDGKSDYSRIISVQHAINNEIYPNPFDQKLTISSADNTDGGIFQIWDSTGKLVLQENIANASTEISTEILAPGIYTGRLTIKNQDPETVKLIKSR